MQDFAHTRIESIERGSRSIELQNDASSGETFEVPATFLRESCLRCALDDWRHLDLQSRALFWTVVRYFRRGKRRIVEAVEAHLAPDGAPSSDDEREVRELLSAQRVHLTCFEILVRRLDAPELEGLCETDDRPFDCIFDDMLADVLRAYAETRSSRERAVAIAMLRPFVLGVLAETGYHGLSLFLVRQDAMSALRCVLDEMRRADRYLASRGMARLRAMLADAPEYLEDVESAFERILLPITDVIRQLQGDFDFVNAGLIPDECVAHALEQFNAYRDQLTSVDGAPSIDGPERPLTL